MRRGLQERGRFFHLRVLALVLALCGAYGLYALSQTDDPRFYYFLTTRSGQWLAGLFGWQRELGPMPRPDRPEKDWEPEELVLKYRWEKELAEVIPLHRLVLTDGQRIDGRLLAEKADGVLFQEAAGEGGLTQSFARQRVVRVETLPRPAHAVSYRDVQLRRSLPEFRFYKRPPFTIATDGQEEDLREAVAELQSRHAELAVVFKDLVVRPPVRTDLPVIFCGRERVFRSFRERYAPDSLHAVGFYVVWLDQLYLMNFDSPDSRDSISRQVLELERTYQLQQAGRPAGAAAWATWREQTVRRIQAAGRRETLATIRHEGAHQFFHTTGVHSSYRAENEWLLEGLATWCESPRLGEPDRGRVANLFDLRRRNELVDLPALVNARRFSDLDGRPDMLYAQAWLLVDWYMQPARRADFFRYVRWLRDPAHLSEVATRPAWELLARETGQSEPVIRAAVASHLDQLAGVRSAPR